jgi:hypothetical protein
MRVQYILHADFEKPGIIRQWASQHHCSEKFCRPFAGEPISNPDEFDLLILSYDDQDIG